jgi:hypothetical protein
VKEVDFLAAYTPPAVAWRNPQPYTTWAAVRVDGTMTVINDLLDVKPSILAAGAHPAVVQVLVTPIPDTLQDNDGRRGAR